jgi:hypothetical protein
MRHLMRLTLLATCVASSVASVPSGAFATTVAQSTAQTARRHAIPLKHSPRLGAHHIFGTILAINGTLLSVRRRNGKLIAVDAGTVIANDDYSYPLFVGKTVAIDGTFPTKTTFLATHIEAVTTLQSLEADK